MTLVGSTLTFTSAYNGNPIGVHGLGGQRRRHRGHRDDRCDAEQPDHRRGLGLDHGSVGSVNITEIDEAVSFSIGASPASISEEAEASATFTISMIGFPLNAGNTATVDLAASGDGQRRR